MYSRISLILIGCFLSLNSTFAAEKTFTMEFDGKDRWDSSLYDRHIDVSTNPGSARLIKTEIIADEMGNTTDATLEYVRGKMRAKKELYIDNPAAEKATLVLYNGSHQGGSFILEVNGKANTITFDKERVLGGGFEKV